MKLKRIMGKFIAMVMAVVIVGSVSIMPAHAEEKIPSITIKVPGCNAVFTMNNVNANYGLYKDYEGKLNYYFLLPNRDSILSCNQSADGGWAYTAPDDEGGGFWAVDGAWNHWLEDWADGEMINLYVDANGNLINDVYDANGYGTGKTFDNSVLKISFIFGNCEGITYESVPYTNGYAGGLDTKELKAYRLPDGSINCPVADIVYAGQ